jgi:hypothetical protein
MRLLVVYVLIVIAVELVAVQIGLYLDHVFPAFSVPLALGLFFAVLGLGWPVAVYVTDRWLTPKAN